MNYAASLSTRTEQRSKNIKSKIEKVELAKAYVALSNAHQLSLINQMFAKQANYNSTGIGLYEGQEAIANMMSSFFYQYPDVHWKAHNFRSDSHGNVLFDFEMKATHVDTRKTNYRDGIELIQFTQTGLISRLEVTVT